MSKRPEFIVDHTQPADGGKPPNQYAAYVSIQIRCHFSPNASREEIRLALLDAYGKALAEADTHSWRNQ